MVTAKTTWYKEYCHGCERDTYVGLYVYCIRNMGLPTGGDPYGNGVPIVRLGTRKTFTRRSGTERWLWMMRRQVKCPLL
jgi:hypothetical protein